MKLTIRTLTGIAVSCWMANGVALAADIQSLTIQEISAMSGGIGTSANDAVVIGGMAYGAGWFNGTDLAGNSLLSANQHFYSAGSTDGALLMGVRQANNAFAVATINGYNLNTLPSAPSGTIDSGVMSLSMPGMTIEAQGMSANAAPQNLTTSISRISANRYFYTADWTHVANNDVNSLNTGAAIPQANGYTWQVHMEGVASLVPTVTPGNKTIVSMSIEEIGDRSGGFSNSALHAGGGNAYLGTQTGTTYGFVSAGSADGQILMGASQDIGDFTLGGMLSGSSALPNTRYGAPIGTVKDGTQLEIDLSGWGLDWNGTQFVLPPDVGTLVTAVEEIDETHYFYTIDWSHLITSDESSQYANLNTFWHLEGILVTAVPEAETYAMMLAGLSLVGLMSHRRRRLI